MTHKDAIYLIKEIIEKIQDIQNLDSLSDLEIQQLNSDLYQISVLTDRLDYDFKNFNSHIRWSMFERLSFSNIGPGFNRSDLHNLIIENKFGLIQEFESFKNLTLSERSSE